MTHKKKNPRKTLIDNKKIGCDFIVTKKINNIVYGHKCNDLCVDSKDITNFITKCKKHLNCEQINEYQNTNLVCKHIITQKSGKIDRKGMLCNAFTFDSPDKNYCKSHSNKKHIDEINNKTYMRSFKVRFYPSNKQKIKLEKYFGDTRFTYNSCVDENASDSFEILRKKYVTEYKKKFTFLEETPKEIRAFAVKEYITNVDNIEKAYLRNIEREEFKDKKYKNYNKKQIKKGVMKNRKKRDDQSITINKNSIKIKNKKIYFYTQSFSAEPIKFIENNKKDKKFNKLLESGIIRHDIKIIKTLTQKYYICFVEEQEEEKTKEKGVIAIDPGGRTFMTTYNENESMNIGTNINEKIGKLLNKKEYYIQKKSESKKENTKKKYIKYRHKYNLIEEKIKNTINDLHYKAISKLLMGNSLILIPILNIKKILKSKQLPKRAKEIIKAESHMLFIKRLQEKCEQKGIKCEIVSEYLTTKICGNCFEKNEVGDKKEYNCKYCNIKHERDVNAARNIYILEILKQQT